MSHNTTVKAYNVTRKIMTWTATAAIAVVIVGAVVIAAGIVVSTLISSIGITANIAWYVITENFLFKHQLLADWLATTSKYLYTLIVIAATIVTLIKFDARTITGIPLLAINVIVVIGLLALVVPAIPQGHANGFTRNLTIGFIYLFSSDSAFDIMTE